VNSSKILVNYTNGNCTGNDECLNTPLIYAAINGHARVVRVLLEGGANIDRPNDYYRLTALHYAAWFGHLDVCRLLLDRGAKVDPVDRRKETPLHDAARWGHLSVVKLLVERGADVRLKNDEGQTARDLAHMNECKEVAEWLNSVSRR
jgi:ankyrin repeat protein